MNTPTPLTPQQIDRLARRRAGAKMGWYAHATVYVLVNLGLAALALANGRHWYAYPLLGWGLARWRVAVLDARAAHGEDAR